jgi:hypothetical protein
MPNSISLQPHHSRAPPLLFCTGKSANSVTAIDGTVAKRSRLQPEFPNFLVTGMVGGHRHPGAQTPPAELEARDRGVGTVSPPLAGHGLW